MIPYLDKRPSRGRMKKLDDDWDTIRQPHCVLTHLSSRMSTGYMAQGTYLPEEIRLKILTYATSEAFPTTIQQLPFNDLLVFISMPVMP